MKPIRKENITKQKKKNTGDLWLGSVKRIYKGPLPLLKGFHYTIIFCFKN